jgi:hypothetical protein
MMDFNRNKQNREKSQISDNVKDDDASKKATSQESTFEKKIVCTFKWKL